MAWPYSFKRKEVKKSIKIILMSKNYVFSDRHLLLFMNYSPALQKNKEEWNCLFIKLWPQFGN